ncbi:MAG: ABC transporter ATP-binding protein [Bacteroidales bacterium]
MDLNNNIVISTKNLSKVYKLYNNPKDRLKEALHPKRKKYHKEFYALRDVNIEIRKGEVIGIIGKNGSGKSTLLKIISNVLTPSKGEFQVKGKVSSLLELGSGFNPELTGIDNIYFYGTILGFAEEKIRSKLQEIIDFADIGDFINQPLKTYSSGMKARLAFAVAINVEPDILILDEILTVGDELFRRKCYARMEGFFKGQKTILFVSHSIADINQLCTRTILLDKGGIILEGPSKLVTAQYQRYLFATPELTSKVLAEIKLINTDKALKENIYSELINTNSESTHHISKQGLNIKQHTNNETQRPVDVKRASYMPGFISKSKVEYRNYDVDITDVNIYTLQGELVNVLITGDRYFYSFKVKFNINCENVVFGMKIKSEKGVNLSGSMSSMYGGIIEKVLKGDIYLIKVFFTCNLMEGTYYTNAGVAIVKKEEYKYLNRITDAYAFKVDRTEFNKNGLIYIDENFKIQKINTD